MHLASPRLTIHSSRSRFAARLNSGVRRHGEFMVGVTHTLLACLFAVAAAGCESMPRLPPPPENPTIEIDGATCISCSWLLEEPELSQLRQKADGGDAAAAFRLAFHFSSADNSQQYEFWMHRAAQLGHRIAQYNVWFTLRDSTSCSDQLEALAWLEKAAAQDVPEATEALESFRQAVSTCRVPPNNSFKPKPLRGSA